MIGLCCNLSEAQHMQRPEQRTFPGHMKRYLALAMLQVKDELLLHEQLTDEHAERHWAQSIFYTLPTRRPALDEG